MRPPSIAEAAIARLSRPVVACRGHTVTAERDSTPRPKTKAPRSRLRGASFFPAGAEGKPPAWRNALKRRLPASPASAACPCRRAGFPRA
ncbi:hypothetical protein DF050_16945 [Burkholderia cepacia]|nr:hypothetical protein DF050_16945 [Burkholderia cepacia]